jgi:voltage-gated potassium channel Kch
MISRSYVIIGYGHFGGRTIEQLLRKDFHSEIIVVDRKGGNQENFPSSC